MDHSRLTLLFNLYVNNNCSERERKEFLDLLADADNEAQVKRLMAALWNNVPDRNLSAEQSERIFQDIVSKDQAGFKQKHFFSWSKIAAAFVVAALGAAGLVYFQGFDFHKDQTVLQEIQGRPAPTFIKLPDGSTVILKAGSVLRYADSFFENAREVFLEGEGYFDIVHNPSVEFVVHTGKLKTTVLGTAFNIEAYPDQKNITVTVKRGKVKVSDDKKIFAIVNPDQQITFDRHHDYAEQNTIDSRQVTSWVEKDIFFDDITMANAVDQLEKRFDISIHIGNEAIKNCRFTATFVKGEDLAQILRILCDFNNATLKENGSGGFIIQGGECSL